MRKYFGGLLVLLLPLISNGQLHWESIVREGVIWKYFAATSEPSSDWYTLGFDDDNWSNGHGGIGYADGDDFTQIDPVNALYLRYTFNINNTEIIEQLLLDIDYDDAFVAYLNGEEIARSSNVVGGNFPAYNSGATTDREALMYQGGRPERFPLTPEVFIEGENVLAVQVLNHSITSSDMSARVFLQAEINSSQRIYSAIPNWFWPPISFDSFDLPLVILETQGQSIPDEPKVTARMKVINNASGINSLDDTDFEYDGLIGIEIRGNSSQMFEKKSYSFETRLEDGSNNNVSLLGLPEENDWVLYAPYTDKSMMRNVLAYQIGRETGRWSPRTKYCEVFLDGDYRGVYVLTEKIKRDENRVDIATVNPEDTEGDEVTGGYILKVGRPETGAWISPYMGRTGSVDVPISYIDPEYHELNEVQREYIRDYVTDFEHMLHGNNFNDPIAGYRSWVDLESFLDYYIINELTRNLDGYRVSTYFYKEKDSNGGKIVMGPLWDYNLGFGNGNFFAADRTQGWVADGLGRGDAYEIPFWWDRLREDPYFDTQLKMRWEELRSGILSMNNINGIINSSVAELANAQHRNYQRFPILGTYIWPNAFVGSTYQEEIDYLKRWISDRIAWMDEEIGEIEEIDITPIDIPFDLPLVVIETNDQAIPDASKIMAQMKLINNPGGINHLIDTIYDYEGFIGIEVDNSDFHDFIKKSYSIETRLEDETNNNVSLLGMPEENDWLLDAPYADKTMIRNVLAYQLGRETGRWAPRTRYCEVFIDGDYRGVYVLTEKIKRDENRLDMATVLPEDNEGEELSGGYLLKTGGNPEEGWVSSYLGSIAGGAVTFEYADPDDDELTATQQEYITNYISAYEHILNGADFADENIGYRNWVDVNSFIDYYLMNELGRNVFAYRYDSYFYKQKKSNGGAIVMGPLWNFHQGFGNTTKYEGDKIGGWVADGIESDVSFDIPFWWERLREDPYFNTKLKLRWTSLRENVLTNGAVNAVIDSTANELAMAQVRNFDKYPMLGKDVWSNALVGASYEEEIAYLKKWVSNRLTWIDMVVASIEEIDLVDTQTNEFSKVAVYPNPFHNQVKFRFLLQESQTIKVEVYSASGAKAFSTQFEGTIGMNTYVLTESDLAAGKGLYVYRIVTGKGMVSSGKLVRE